MISSMNCKKLKGAYADRDEMTTRFVNGCVPFSFLPIMKLFFKQD